MSDAVRTACEPSSFPAVRSSAANGRADLLVTAKVAGSAMLHTPALFPDAVSPADATFP